MEIRCELSHGGCVARNALSVVPAFAGTTIDFDLENKPAQSAFLARSPTCFWTYFSSIRMVSPFRSGAANEISSSNALHHGLQPPRTMFSTVELTGHRHVGERVDGAVGNVQTSRLRFASARHIA